MGALWAAFAPIEVGGTAAYVVINGNSMEPRIHRGDLVIVHAADRYQVGDVVTYRYPGIGRVIHRIVAQDGDRFTMKGDYNTWLDGYEPTAGDVIGKEWIHVSSLGTSISAVRQPMSMALLAGFAGITLTGGLLKTQRKVRRRGGRRRLI